MGVLAAASTDISRVLLIFSHRSLSRGVVVGLDDDGVQHDGDEGTPMDMPDRGDQRRETIQRKDQRGPKEPNDFNADFSLTF